MHHPALIYYVRTLLGGGAGGAGSAEDAVQEVWLAAHRQLGRLKEVAAFKSWLYRIARNKALDARRARRMEPINGGAETFDPIAGGGADGAGGADFSPEDAARVHEGLRQLTLEHREVLTLRFLEDMSHADIAAVTGADVGTVKSRIFYAKQSLRRVMEQSV
jgi:RNA polymerase sigma-70 factor (ECF subfamily)